MQLQYVSCGCASARALRRSQREEATQPHLRQRAQLASAHLWRGLPRLSQQPRPRSEHVLMGPWWLHAAPCAAI